MDERSPLTNPSTPAENRGEDADDWVCDGSFGVPDFQHSPFSGVPARFHDRTALRGRHTPSSSSTSTTQSPNSDSDAGLSSSITGDVTHVKSSYLDCQRPLSSLSQQPIHLGTTSQHNILSGMPSRHYRRASAHSFSNIIDSFPGTVGPR